jgi:pseudoazurin
MISLLLISNLVNAGTTQIEFTENDTYSLEVAQINVGDTIEWLPKNKGHNVEFLAGPDMNALPPKSKLNSLHSVIFELPGVYLYQCTPHGNMGMLGLVVVGNDFHNLQNLNEIKLSRVATSVLKRLTKKALEN